MMNASLSLQPPTPFTGTTFTGGVTPRRVIERQEALQEAPPNPFSTSLPADAFSRGQTVTLENGETVRIVPVPVAVMAKPEKKKSHLPRWVIFAGAAATACMVGGALTRTLKVRQWFNGLKDHNHGFMRGVGHFMEFFADFALWELMFEGAEWLLHLL